MTLNEHMERIPKSRKNGFPAGDEPVREKLVVCVLLAKASGVCAAISRACPGAEIEAVCLPKNQFAALPGKKIIHVGNLEIPAISTGDVDAFRDCTPVIAWDGCVAPDLLYFPDISRKTRPVIFPAVLPGMAGCKHEPDFYTDNSVRLEDIYARLADEGSRLQFASVVKAIVTGSIEWIIQSPYDEYLLPAALPQEDDIVVDAGLFDSVVLRRFALAVPAGHVYGFEPEPNNYRFVEETLERYGDPGNVTLVRKGLFSRKGGMFISDEGSSGNLSDESSKGSACEVVDLDSFVAENAIPKVNLVKMDIEGAELEALRGARTTISKFTPKLHICAYHRTGDLLAIPEFLEDVAKDRYDLHFAAHVPYMNEYVYYAVPRGKRDEQGLLHL